MSVRRAKQSDIAAIVEMGARFHVVSGLDRLPFDEKHMRQTVEFMIAHEDSAAFVLETGGGVILGQVSRSWFGPGIVASEMMWWVNPGKRGGTALRYRFERWARTKGAALVGMAARDERVGKVLTRGGYQPAETHYTKELD